MKYLIAKNINKLLVLISSTLIYSNSFAIGLNQDPILYKDIYAMDVLLFCRDHYIILIVAFLIIVPVIIYLDKNTED